MTKKNKAITTSAIDMRKPLVKDFIDPDKAVLDFLLTRLPHVSKAKPKVNRVYQSQDKSLNRFRVNWWTDDGIVKSGYYEVILKEGAFDLHESL